MNDINEFEVELAEINGKPLVKHLKTVEEIEAEISRQEAGTD